LSTGTLKGALAGAATGAVFGGIGAYSQIAQWGKLASSVSHGFAGGSISVLNGEKFGHGFISAGIAKYANVNEMYTGDGTGDMMLRVGTAAAIGGTVSEVTGGKFANGAATAAFAFAVSSAMSSGKNGKEKHFNRNKDSGLYEDLPQTAEELMSVEGWEEKWVVRSGVETHNFGTSGNLDFREAGPCPCRQLIYDANGYLVTDQTNGGSLDYVSPSDSVIGHFEKDVVPWIRWGNGPLDTTTMQQRAAAAASTAGSSIMPPSQVREYYSQ
jgi:hypothetical protein